MLAEDPLLAILSEQYGYSREIQDAIKRKTFFITACPGINGDFYAGSTGDKANIPCLMPTIEEAQEDYDDLLRNHLEYGGNDDDFEHEVYQVIYHNINKVEVQSVDGKITYGFQDANSLCGHNLRLL